MPVDPSPAQRAASRKNGARSRGPVTPEGRERIAAAATRHGLAGAFRLLPGESEAAFLALREGWAARLRPRDSAEAAAVDKIVVTVWRERRLAVVEDRLLAALGEGAPTDGLPSLATVIRYRARLERDRERAEAELAGLRAAADPEARAEAWRPEAGEPAPSACRQGADGTAERGAIAPDAPAGPRAAADAPVPSLGSWEVAAGDRLPATGPGEAGRAERMPVGSEGRPGGTAGDGPGRPGPLPGAAGARPGATALADRPGTAGTDEAELGALLEGIEARLDAALASRPAEPWAEAIPAVLRALAGGGPGIPSAARRAA